MAIDIFYIRLDALIRNGILSEEEISENLNIPLSEVDDWTTNVKVPSVRQFIKLVNTTNIPADYFLGLDKETQRLSKITEQIMEQKIKGNNKDFITFELKALKEKIKNAKNEQEKKEFTEDLNNFMILHTIELSDFIPPITITKIFPNNEAKLNYRLKRYIEENSKCD